MSFLGGESYSKITQHKPSDYQQSSYENWGVEYGYKNQYDHKFIQSYNQLYFDFS